MTVFSVSVCVNVLKCGRGQKNKNGGMVKLSDGFMTVHHTHPSTFVRLKSFQSIFFKHTKFHATF